MYAPETEDMLPRSAPKPTSQDINEQKVMPVVPEISILYGQGDGEPIKAQQKPKPQSYAAWKKQVLPRVTFPPEGKEVTGSMPANNNQTAQGDYNQRSNIYPMRTTTATISPLVAANNYHNNVDALQYRRSLESAHTYTSSMPQEIPTNAIYHKMQQQQQQFRPVELIAQRYDSKQDVLTICAGTQTDTVVGSPTASAIPETVIRNFATKQDIDLVLATIQQMREEQQHLTQLCESILMQQQQQQQELEQLPKTYCKDVGTQYEPLLNNGTKAAPINRNHNSAETIENTPVNNIYIEVQQPAQNQMPSAESTAYRPIASRQGYDTNPAAQHFYKQNQQNMANGLPKPNTEKSMVMNELALKYLPNEKLNELLSDLEISAPLPPEPVTPLRHIENLNRGHNDISNASYKYLKKYRLLPEENQQHVERAQSPATRASHQQSPYNRQASPQTVQRGIQQQHLDLEHIRHQPKFL